VARNDVDAAVRSVDFVGERGYRASIADVEYAAPDLGARAGPLREPL
jgi:hypothetical protein